MKQRIFAAIAVFVMPILAIGQATMSVLDPDQTFKQGKEYVQKEQYSLAYPLFKAMYAHGIGESQIPVTVQTEVNYYYLLCGLRLNDSTVLQQAIDYIHLEHHRPRVEMLAYHLGDYYFRMRQYNSSLKYFEKAGLAHLTNAQIADMKFKQGYGHFYLKDFAKALPLFDVVRQFKDDPNYIDANYYYGFLQFSEKRYDLALPAFRIAEAGIDYRNVTAFYITEILYFQGKKQEAISFGEKAIKSGWQYYDLEMRQLLGHMLFDQQKYEAALPYLEQYVEKSSTTRKEDIYELSYCYYQTKQWEKAAKGFKQLSGREDSLAQNSMYLLADAYLKLNDKPNARNAFLFCATNNSNPTQQEVSLFSYAKLSYELNFLQEALQSLRQFRQQYPKSKFFAESKELYVNVLANTSNYKEALDEVKAMSPMTDNLRQVYPKIIFGRATELINEQQLDVADALLNELLTLPYNNQQIQLAYFWKGELAYRMGNTEQATQYFINYLKMPQPNGEANSTNAKYSLAYAYLKLEKYREALNFFDQLVIPGVSPKTSIEQDVWLRIADCYFMNRDYNRAGQIYDQVIQWGLPTADYAYFQKAVLAGAKNATSEKMRLLQQMEQLYPKSGLLADAQLELANAFLSNEAFNEAIVPLRKILNDQRAENLHPQVLLKLGIAHFNLNKNDESLQYFKSLIVRYGQTNESDDAIEYLRSLFVDRQQPGEYVKFLRENGKNVSFTEADSITYKVAANRYDLRDFVSAKNGFQQYLQEYENGKYVLEANYFLAEIFVNEKDQLGALPYYQKVASKSPNKYAERSLLQSARILFFQKKDFSEAAGYYRQLKQVTLQQENKLEAMRGLLRCEYRLQLWKEALVNAEELLQFKGIANDDRMMANMIVARNHQLQQQNDQALVAYRNVVSIGSSEFSAEAQYRIAEILFTQNKMAEAEKNAFIVIRKMGSYIYWVTKSYLLLGDIYYAQKDYFNAEATYKSIVENAEIEEIKQEAAQRLRQLQANSKSE